MKAIHKLSFSCKLKKKSNIYEELIKVKIEYSKNKQILGG